MSNRGINPFDHQKRRWRIALACGAAIMGFAANSLLARGALGGGLIDASTYTLVRLSSGALLLGAISLLRRQSLAGHGSWAAGAALAAYAAAFSFSYLRIGAALGALVLFPIVKLSLLLWGARQGQHPAKIEWLGAFIALAGLVGLSLPGAKQPDPLGIALMIVAGIAWAIYTVEGRSRSKPFEATARNFLLAAASAAPLVVFSLFGGHATPRGILLAALSGAFASGLIYWLWYTVVPALTAMQMGMAQLAVPALATFGAVVLLGEILTPRIIIAASAIFTGIGLSLARLVIQLL
jgi:drug/metabolite transporter (DMT)-like permease